MSKILLALIAVQFFIAIGPTVQVTFSDMRRYAAIINR